MNKTFIFLYSFFICISVFSQPAVSKRYPSMIAAPANKDEWPAWRQKLRLWKDSVRTAINYNDHYYASTSYQWQQAAYSTFFLVATEQTLYNKDWSYNITRCLKKYEESYGGVDIVLLWPTYPQLGWDNRDQYSLYRGLPGGTARLKELADELHRMGKKLMIAYNPWDNIARNNGRNDEEELIKLVTEIGADGIFLDTIDSVSRFREKLDNARPGVIFQSELPPPVDIIAEVHQSWCEEWFGPEVLNETPAVMRNRWLEQRHMVYQLLRWSHDQTQVFQSAWQNGCGLVLWENVFGTWVELNKRDQSFMREMLPILRRYSDYFTTGEWTPLYQCAYTRTYASEWKKDQSKLYTIVYRLDTPGQGNVIEIDHEEGNEYYDLTEGRKADVKITGKKALVFMKLVPKDIRAILVTSGKNENEGLQHFLNQMAEIRKQHSNNHEPIHQPIHLLKHNPTNKYLPGRIPANMVVIPVAPDSIIMETNFRNREPGFYPVDKYVDHSFEAWNLDKTFTIKKKVKLAPFAMDETPVTNKQFYDFIKATRYAPEFGDNFLNHWVNGKPPKGQENHPVIWVTLEDARKYATWAGKRLPTEEEWQWAAQSGDKKNKWPWGNTYDSAFCNHGQLTATSPVKKFADGKSPWGLYDMSGNVWQWTESERSDGHNRFAILKGGAWYKTNGSGWYADQGPQPADWSSKYLFTWPGLDRCATVGFRCVVDIKH